jgi:hypothetical protein
MRQGCFKCFAEATRECKEHGKVFCKEHGTEHFETHIISDQITFYPERLKLRENVSAKLKIIHSQKRFILQATANFIAQIEGLCNKAIENLDSLLIFYEAILNDTKSFKTKEDLL